MPGALKYKRSLAKALRWFLFKESFGSGLAVHGEELDL